MKNIKTLLLCIALGLTCSITYGQTSHLDLMPEIGKLDSDLIVIVKNTTSPKLLETKIETIKKWIKDAEITYTYKDGLIVDFSFDGSGHGCASDKFGTFVVSIKGEEVQSCHISDRTE